MNKVRVPDGWRFESLRGEHPRNRFHSGALPVDDWLMTKALQNQKKRLSATKVLLNEAEEIAGYYTLATGQVDFGDLPAAAAKGLPRRMLPVAVVAWLGVQTEFQGQGVGRLLLAQALRDCHEAGKIFAFIAVVVDCLNDAAKAFYKRWDFAELPGHPNRLFLKATLLDAMIPET